MNISKENLIRILVVGIVLTIVLVGFLLRKRNTTKTEPGTFTTVKDEEKTDTTETPIENLETPSYYEVSEALDFLTEYPWYRDLPVETDMYIISWNLDREEFRLRLKIPENSSQETINTYTQSAVAGLKELTGELFDKYTYYIMYQEN
ncbi:MAG: hypothetical protein ABIA11_02935 [Patescibacteria group bacterium]